MTDEDIVKLFTAAEKAIGVVRFNDIIRHEVWKSMLICPERNHAEEQNCDLCIYKDKCYIHTAMTITRERIRNDFKDDLK